MAWIGEININMEKYCRQLPPEDQAILREYFVPVSEIYKSKKGPYLVSL